MPNPDNNRWRLINISINFTISEIIIIFAQKYIRIPQVCAIVNLSLRFLLKKRIEKR